MKTLDDSALPACLSLLLGWGLCWYGLYWIDAEIFEGGTPRDTTLLLWSAFLWSAIPGLFVGGVIYLLVSAVLQSTGFMEADNYTQGAGLTEKTVSEIYDAHGNYIDGIETDKD